MTDLSTRPAPFGDGLNDIIVGLHADGTPYPVGKLEAHQRSTRHKAVSVFVLDGERLLLQRRAAGKYHSPGLWANTACSHPLWGEEAHASAERTLMRELGISLPLRHFASLGYEARVGDLYENEAVDCFIGIGNRQMTLELDPDEVSECRWAEMADLPRQIAAAPGEYAPWLRIYVEQHQILSLIARR